MLKIGYLCIVVQDNIARALFPDTPIFKLRYPVKCRVYTGYHATGETEYVRPPVGSIIHSLNLVD